MSLSTEVWPCPECGQRPNDPRIEACRTCAARPIPRLDCRHLNVTEEAKPVFREPLPGRCNDCGASVPHSSTRGFDEIDRPRHYNQGQIECWDYIVDKDMGYLEGCVIKYVTRFRLKGTPLKDLRKARAYLDRLISQVEREES